MTDGAKLSPRAAAPLAHVAWGRTPLGDPDGWPPPLRAAVEIIAHSALPMLVWWGPELVMVANEASTSLLGGLTASGRRASDVWGRHWPSLDQDIARVRQRLPVVRERLALTSDADASPTYLTHALTPLDDGHGAVGGFLEVCVDETPRVRAEQWQRVLESITGSVFAVDARWRFTFANAAAEQLLGKAKGALLGRTLWDEFPGLLGSEFERVYRRAMTERVEASVQSFYPDSARWYEVHVHPALAAVDGLAMYFHDITQRTRDEATSRDNLALLQGISDSTGDVIYAKDREGRFRFANPAALALIGKPAPDVMGRTDLEVLENQEAARGVMENDRQVMDTGVPVDVEEVVPLPDGTKRVWLSRKMPNRDAEGRIVGLLGVSRDVTEQKRAWERLRRLYDVVAALAEVASLDDIARVTVHQGILAVGATSGSLALLSDDGTTLEMAGMIGYAEGAIDAWRTFSSNAPVPLAEAVRTGQPVYTNTPAQRLARYPALQSLRTHAGIRSSACLPLITRGRTVGVLGLGFEVEHDFTEEDRAFMLSLSHQCAQALDRVRLFAAERGARGEAERASRMKDEFLATLSHELRTPLNAILGWATILERGTDDVALVTKGVATIQRSARAQALLVEDLLDMSAILNGNVRVELGPCDLLDVLHAAIETIRPTAEAKGVRLLAALGTDPAPLLGDPGRLQQVLSNLLTNAVKFTPSGGEVTLVLDRDGSKLAITVTDTGEGIAAGFLPHVFDRFRQADSSKTRRHGGVGLGLSIAKQLVELHGGTIRVESRGLGLGTTFTVDLPAARGAAEPS